MITIEYLLIGFFCIITMYFMYIAYIEKPLYIKDLEKKYTECLTSNYKVTELIKESTDKWDKSERKLTNQYVSLLNNEKDLLDMIHLLNKRMQRLEDKHQEILDRVTKLEQLENVSNEES